MAEAKLTKGDIETLNKSNRPSKDEAFKADLLADAEKAASLSRNPAVNRVLERMIEKLQPRSVPRMSTPKPDS